jgi:hypothetical protein
MFAFLGPTDQEPTWGEALSKALEDLFAAKFIARTDAKAIQYPGGSWSPHNEYNTETRKHDGPRIPWRREDLDAHLSGERTFGHYLLSSDSKAKLFAFDCDWEKTGWLPTLPLATEDEVAWKESFIETNPREMWLQRGFTGRDFMKLQMKQLAHKLLRSIIEELKLPCAAAYSGGKGFHVYAFTGLMDAWEVREGAHIVLESIGEFEPLRGENFFKHKDDDPVNGFKNFSIELFPKQDSLDGKDLGNLMRLPLGVNLKAPKEPTFFINMNTPLAELSPMDAATALQIENPWMPF